MIGHDGLRVATLAREGYRCGRLLGQHPSTHREDQIAVFLKGQNDVQRWLGIAYAPEQHRMFEYGVRQGYADAEDGGRASA